MPHDAYLWRCFKYNIYNNNSHIEDDRREITWYAVLAISQQERQIVLIIYSPGVKYAW